MASQGSARNSETPDASDDKAMGSARETVDSTRTTFKLREVRTGEQRLLGVLFAIDCGPPGVRFHARANGRYVVAAAKRMENVDLIAYGNTHVLSISCGACPRRFHVLHARASYVPRDVAAHAVSGRSARRIRPWR
jgi:hypothetical protein